MKRSPIDWNQVRGRLRASESAIELALADGPRRIEEVYLRRALELARPAAQPTAGRGLPSLVFKLGQERYAIELKDLTEVLPFRRCVPVPGAPRQFLGIINLRGELRPVADARRLLTPAAGPAGDSGFVLMLRRPGQEIGLKVDDVEDLREIRREELSQAGQGGSVQGIAAGSVMLLDVDAVLASVLSKGSFGSK